MMVDDYDGVMMMGDYEDSFITTAQWKVNFSGMFLCASHFLVFRSYTCTRSFGFFQSPSPSQTPIATRRCCLSTMAVEYDGFMGIAKLLHWSFGTS